jgi:HEAT repeat protein
VVARRNAVATIATIAPDELPALFAEIKKHNDPNVRAVAYQSLYLKIGKKGVISMLPAKLTVPLLIEAARDSAVNVRLIGVQGLSSYGAAARAAAPVPTDLLNDPDARIRQLAQTTLDAVKAK